MNQKTKDKTSWTKQQLLLPSPIDLLAFDFDGVLTDNSVYIDKDGLETVRCSRSDGLGIEMLHSAKIPMCIISTEANAVVAARGNRLKLKVFQAVKNKAEFLQQYLMQEGLRAEHTIFVGNDVNDLGALKLAGCAIVPADAHPSIMGIAHIHLKAKGGNGAVRELCDMILDRLQLQ